MALNCYDKPPLQEFLAHHGIKGQKWGVRRYQNEDGTYTTAGKKRYSASAREQMKSEAQIQWAKKMYGVSRQTSDQDSNARYLSWLKKVADEDYGKKYGLTKSFGYTKDDVRKYHQEEIQDFTERVKKGEALVRNSALMEEKLDLIDTSSIRYRDAKKLVKKLVSDMINDSINEDLEGQ